jgi:hypothetical protein
VTEETLFSLALGKPPGAERRALLEGACGGDEALRERVERLLGRWGLPPTSFGGR